MNRRDFELNGPVIMSRDQSTEGEMDKSNRDEALAIVYPYDIPKQDVQQVQGLSRERELERLQTQFPFLPINPPLSTFRMVIAQPANVDYHAIEIPSGTKMINLAIDGDQQILFSFDPIEPFTSLPVNGPTDGTIQVLAINGQWIPVYGQSKFYLRRCNGSVGAVVNVRFFSQL